MAKGLIASFLGGASQGMADAGRMMFAQKLRQEGEEAADLRNRALQGSRQDFLTGEREASQEFRAGESKLDRESAQGIAKDKATASSKSDATTNMKDAAALRAAGYPSEVADAVAHGALKQIKDDETGDMVLVNALNNKPVGRLTSSGSGEKVWLPEGERLENAEVTSKHRKDAKKATDKKASWFSTDETDFSETGGDRNTWRKGEAQRLANEERGGGKTGIVNSAADINRSVPKTTMPAPKKAAPKAITAAPKGQAPKAALDYLKNNPKALPQFIKKYGYDPTK